MKAPGMDSIHAGCLCEWGRLAATAATTAVIATTAVVVIDEQQDDNDEQDPSAIVTAEKISQTTHILPPPFLAYTPYYVVAQTVVPISFGQESLNITAKSYGISFS